MPAQYLWRTGFVAPQHLGSSWIRSQTCISCTDFFTTEPPGKPSVQSLSCVWLWPHGLQHTRLPVHHQLPEFAQTPVHRVSDAIQPSHPLSSPSPPAFSLSQHHLLLLPSAFFQHHGLFPMSQFFTSDGQNFGASASVLPMNIQDWFPLGLTGLISLQFKELPGEDLRREILPLLFKKKKKKVSYLWLSLIFWHHLYFSDHQVLCCHVMSYSLWPYGL